MVDARVCGFADCFLEVVFWGSGGFLRIIDGVRLVLLW